MDAPVSISKNTNRAERAASDNYSLMENLIFIGVFVVIAAACAGVSLGVSLLVSWVISLFSKLTFGYIWDAGGLALGWVGSAVMFVFITVYLFNEWYKLSINESS